MNKTGNKKCKMCIINVYGPTQQEFPEGKEAYYDALHRNVTQYRKFNYIVIMAGDFNAKL